MEDGPTVPQTAFQTLNEKPIFAESIFLLSVLVLTENKGYFGRPNQ